MSMTACMAKRIAAGNFEGDAILAWLREVIERLGESRFTRWESAAAKIEEHGPRTIDRLGFRKTLEHGMGDAMHTTNTYYVLPEAWRSEIFRGMNINAVNKELFSAACWNRPATARRRAWSGCPAWGRSAATS
jgi:hypothetical protein